MFARPAAVSESSVGRCPFFNAVRTIPETRHSGERIVNAGLARRVPIPWCIQSDSGSVKRWSRICVRALFVDDDTLVVVVVGKNRARSDRTLNPHPVSKVSSLCGDGACR